MLVGKCLKQIYILFNVFEWRRMGWWACNMTGSTKYNEHVLGKGQAAYSTDDDSGTLGVLTNNRSVNCRT
jgi:hypothetical protein